MNVPPPSAGLAKPALGGGSSCPLLGRSCSRQAHRSKLISADVRCRAYRHWFILVVLAVTQIHPGIDGWAQGLQDQVPSSDIHEERVADLFPGSQAVPNSRAIDHTDHVVDV